MKSIYTLLFAALTLTLTAQCIEDGHSPWKNQGWKSCSTSVGPIPERGNQHWMMYDFGHVYNLQDMHYWNHNVWGETGMGAKSIIIDFSLDKENWTTIGPIELERAPGSWKYTGVHLENMSMGIDCQYLLITVVDTWEGDSDCAAIAEFRFGLGEVTSTEEEIVAEGINLYPNPAREYFHLQIPEDITVNKATIYTSTGQIVQQVPTYGTQETVVSIQDLNPGIYFVSVESKKGVITKSFYKE